MTNEQINAAIAEVCGWKPETYGPTWHETETKMPDYCTDLNAMHQAEKVLGPYQLLHMKGRLSQKDIEPMTATARQRAEAFLRTIGKWEEAAK